MMSKAIDWPTWHARGAMSAFEAEGYTTNTPRLLCSTFDFEHEVESHESRYSPRQGVQTTYSTDCQCRLAYEGAITAKLIVHRIRLQPQQDIQSLVHSCRALEHPNFALT
jgi:hypothetical protein